MLGGRPLEIDDDRVDALDLLEGVGLAVAHGHDQQELVGVLLGDLGQDLDEIEGPAPPRKLLGVGESVVPGLKFVEDQGRRGVLE